jgi:hypothetical protein
MQTYEAQVNCESLLHSCTELTVPRGSWVHYYFSIKKNRTHWPSYACLCAYHKLRWKRKRTFTANGLKEQHLHASVGPYIKASSVTSALLGDATNCSGRHKLLVVICWIEASCSVNKNRKRKMWSVPRILTRFPIEKVLWGLRLIKAFNQPVSPATVCDV